MVLGKKYRLGRQADCAFVVNDLSISRVHAELTAKAGSVLVKDLDSKNGTFVNDVKISEAEVMPDQLVKFGNALFQLLGHEIATLPELSTLAIHSESVQPLSDAQQRVLACLLRGCSQKETANELGISPNTVHVHVSAIYAYCNVHSRAELLALFVSESKMRAK